MRVATFNVHDNPAAVRRSLELAGLLLWQEFPRGYKPTEDGDAEPGWDVSFNGHGAVVTGWRLRWWTYYGCQWHTAHDGRKRVTPQRGDLVVKLIHKKSNRAVAVVNSHRINRTGRAWLAVPGVHARWRRARMAEHVALTERVVADLVKDGWLVIGGGDYNDRRAQLPHPDARWLVHGGIDVLWVVGRDADQIDVDAVRGLGSDHPLRRALIRIRRGGAR